jgi:hypothetical protein
MVERQNNKGTYSVQRRGCFVTLFLGGSYRPEKKLFAEGIISGIIEMRGDFLLFDSYPGDSSKTGIKILRFNHPSVYNNLKGGDKTFTCNN